MSGITAPKRADCVMDGCEKPAHRQHPMCSMHRGRRQWSLDDRRAGGIDSEYGPFSTDLSRYVPRCVPCHKRHDLAGLAQ